MHIGQSVKTALCGVGPYYLGRIHSMNVTTDKGKDDGSNNNVEYKICSDVDDLCCKANPDSVSSNEYQKGKTDRKKATDFGDCAKYLFKVSSFHWPSLPESTKFSFFLRSATLPPSLWSRTAKTA